MIELNRRLLVYPTIGFILWCILTLWASSEVHRIAEQERVGQGVESLLRTTGEYRHRSESLAAEGAAYRAAARLSDARSRTFEDSMHRLEGALADNTKATNAAAAALGDTGGSAADWRDLFKQQTYNVQTATVALGHASSSLNACRAGEASRDSAYTVDSLALLACANRADSLTRSLGDLKRLNQCRIIFFRCPSRKEALVGGAFAGVALYRLLTGH